MAEPAAPQPQQVSDPYGLLQRPFQVDPYPTYARLRQDAPVHFSEGWGGFVLTRYADVLNGFKDPRMSSNRAAAFSAALPPQFKEAMAPVTGSLSRWALLVDPPDHTRLRGLVNHAFTPRLVEYLRPRIEDLVAGMLDQAVKRGGELEVVSELANPLPVAVIGDMLGIPREDGPKLKLWSDGFAAFFGTPRPTPQILSQMKTGVVEMEEYFRGQMAERRKKRGDDLLSTLIAAEDAGAVLTDEEILATCSMVLFAGHETTTHLISNAIHLLGKDPGQRDALAAPDPTVAVEELLRFESPIQRLSRIAREDFELHGQKVAKNQKIFLMIGAANRDPQQFPDADRLQLSRADNRHLAFAIGPHYCLGAPLGRMEGQIALTTLIKRFPKYRLIDQEPERLDSVAFRGFKSLRIALA